MYTCCRSNFSSQSEYDHHRHNIHYKWPEKPYCCEGHPMDEDGKPIGNRTVLYSSEFRVWKHKLACLHNKEYICMIVGDMTSVKVDRPPQQGIDTGTDEWESRKYFQKRLLSKVQWLIEVDLDTIANDQNSRNLNDYIFSTKMNSQICTILFPHSGPFKLRRWVNFGRNGI